MDSVVEMRIEQFTCKRMRLISGSAGGIPLEVPKSVTRPTQDRVRQAVFSMLAEVIADARVLDLFAGSGAFGLECLSRGAKSAMLADQDRGACEVIRRNAAKTRLQGVTVRQSDVFRLLELLHGDGAVFDLVFADPPYKHKASDTDFTARLLENTSLPGIVADGGLLVLEALDARTPPAHDPVVWELLADRTYGSTRVMCLRKRAAQG